MKRRNIESIFPLHDLLKLSQKINFETTYFEESIDLSGQTEQNILWSKVYVKLPSLLRKENSQ